MACFPRFALILLGLLVAGPVGALVAWILTGLASNHSSSAEPDDEEPDPGPYSRSRSYARQRATENFLSSLMTLAASVMRADGEARKSEAEYVKDFLRSTFPAEEAQKALYVLRDSLQDPNLNWQKTANEIGLRFGHQVRAIMLQFLLRLAMADGEATQREMDIISNIASRFLISASEFEALKAMCGMGASSGYHERETSVTGISLRQAYRILQLEETCTNEEVKKAYRTLAKKNHPDRVASQGPAAVKVATEKFQKIQEAYEAVCHARGIK